MMSRARHADAMAPLGLRSKEHAALLTLQGEGPISQQALGRYLRIDPGSMVDLVDELERRRLVERRRNPADRRAYAIHLTPAGEEMLRQAEGVAREVEDDILRGLTPEERETLQGLLRRILADRC
jgi:DNA-binding MarR family transcriptional regulator